MAICKVFAEGVVAALTGGYYHDKSQTDFINLSHLYLWLLLFSLPICISLMSFTPWICMSIYSMTVMILIGALKLITMYLHHLFDTTEPVRRVEFGNEPPSTEDADNDIPLDNSMIRRSHSRTNRNQPDNSPNDEEKTLFGENSLCDQFDPFGASSVTMRDNSLNDVRNSLDCFEGPETSVFFRVGRNRCDSPVPWLHVLRRMRTPTAESNLTGLNEACPSVNATVDNEQGTSSNITNDVNLDVTTEDKSVKTRSDTAPIESGVDKAPVKPIRVASVSTESSALVSQPSSRLVPLQQLSRADCRRRLEAMRKDVDCLQIPKLPDDFEPSLSDLSLLDPNPTNRNYVTSISRSRNNSQRRRSFRANHPLRNQTLTATVLQSVTTTTTTTTTVRRHSSANSGVLPLQMRTRLQQLRVQREIDEGTLTLGNYRSAHTNNRRRDAIPTRTQSLRHTSSNVTAGLVTASDQSTAVTLSRQSTFTGASLQRAALHPIANASVLRSRPQSLRRDDKLLWSPVAQSDSVTGIQSCLALQVFQSPDQLEGHSSITCDQHFTKTSQPQLGHTVSEKTVASSTQENSPYINKSILYHFDETKELEQRNSDSEDNGGLVMRLPSVVDNATSCSRIDEKHEPSQDPDQSHDAATVDGSSTSTMRSQSFQRRRRGAIRRTSKPQLTSSQATGVISNTHSRYTVAEEDDDKLLLNQKEPGHSKPWHSRRPGASSSGTCVGGPSGPSSSSTSVPFLDLSEWMAAHDDTTTGSEHWFQDPNGEWMVYTFGNDNGEAMTIEEWMEKRNLERPPSTLLQMPHPMNQGKRSVSRLDLQKSIIPKRSLIDHPDKLVDKNQYVVLPDDLPQYSFDEIFTNRMSTSSFAPIALDDSVNPTAQPSIESGGRVATPALENSFDFVYRRNGFTFDLRDNPASSLDIANEPWENWRPFISEVTEKRRSLRKKNAHYRFRLFPFAKRLFDFKFGRLDLDAFLDRNRSSSSILGAVLLGGVVSVLATLLLLQHHFQNVSLLIFSAVIASTQFCLLKSVQPDTASPQQGYNAIILYSRGAYFCLFSLGLLLCDLVLQSYNALPYLSHSISNYGGLSVPITRFTKNSSTVLTLYGVELHLLTLVAVTHRIFYYLLLYFPVLFLFGLLPQINTFSIYIMEQIDIHIFGASGAAGFLEVLFSLFRNVFELCIVYGFCYGGLVLSSTINGQPHVFLSIFWGTHLGLVYLLSRIPCNLISYFRAIRSFHEQRRQASNQATESAPSPLTTSSAPLAPTNTTVVDTEDETIDRTISNDVQHDKLSVTSSMKSKPCQELQNGDYHSVRGECETSQDDDCCVKTTPLTPSVSVKLLTEVENSIEETTIKREQSTSKSIEVEIVVNPQRENHSKVDSEEKHQTRQRYAIDPQPRLMTNSLCSRVRTDIISVLVWCVIGFAVHVSTAFTSSGLQPHLHRVVFWLVIVVGFILHYVWPHMQKPCPWQILNKPLIKPSLAGRVTMWEAVYTHLLWLERNFFMHLLVLSAVSLATQPMLTKFGPLVTAVLLPLCSLKMLRHGFSQGGLFYLNLLFAHLIFHFDYVWANEGLLLNYMITSFVVSKARELILKLHFVFVYIAPWKMIWGSVFHGFAQLAYVPHSMFLILQCFISTLFSAPLEPFLASAIFIASYVRPIKFWEASYTTHYADNSNTALSSQMRQAFEPSGESTNAIFYEHLTRSMQRSLAGDILLGRWGTVNHGDIYILAYEEFHFLVHIIEMGNGYVTFQLRGLELIGTFCHEHETEELRRNPRSDSGCCCCQTHCWFPHLLSFNAAMGMRWSAWELIFPAYYLDAYSISDHSAITSLQILEFRKLIVLYFVRSIIYYTCKLFDLKVILSKLQEQLSTYNSVDYAEYDIVFGDTLNDDFDAEVNGISRRSFLTTHSLWIDTCLKHRYEQNPEQEDGLSGAEKSLLESLCFALSLFGRRCVFSGYRMARNSSLDGFLSGFYNIFNGNIQVNPPDEWVLGEVSLLPRVVQSGIHMAVKLYQDQFVCANLSDEEELYSCISNTERQWVICHESDPLWRNAVLNDAPNLCSFRLTGKSVQYFQVSYRIVMYSRNRLQFRVVKINSECVRGLWASQQQEQIFLRNRNPERGSIQHAKQVLRNLINSSCDQPIGYPIYVSPLTTSFAEDSEAYHEAAKRMKSSLLLLGVRVETFHRFVSRIHHWLLQLRHFCHSMRVRSGDSVSRNSRSRTHGNPTNLDGQESLELTALNVSSSRRGNDHSLPRQRGNSPSQLTFTSSSFLAINSSSTKGDIVKKPHIHLESSASGNLAFPPSGGITKLLCESSSIGGPAGGGGGGNSSHENSTRISLNAPSWTNELPFPHPSLEDGNEFDVKFAMYVSTVASLGGNLHSTYVITNPRDILLDKHNKLNWPHSAWRGLAAHALTLLLPSRPISTSSLNTGPNTTNSSVISPSNTNSSSAGTSSSKGGGVGSLNTSVLNNVRGLEIHRWTPSHPDLCRRSFCHRVIVLLRVPCNTKAIASTSNARDSTRSEGSPCDDNVTLDEKGGLSPFKTDTFWLIYSSGLQTVSPRETESVANDNA